MKILIVTQYFWPENFRINDVAQGLKERGHEVSVLTGKPNYPQGRYFPGYSWWKKGKEDWDGVTIYRANIILRGNGGAAMLALNYFSLAFSTSLRLLTMDRKYDRILVFQPSPVTIGLPGVLARALNRAKSYIWVQDLWPESVKYSGNLDNKYVLKVTGWLTEFIYRHTTKLLVQSKAFIPYILDQGVPSDKIIYYPNYAEDFYKPVTPDPEYGKKMPQGFNLVFAGNIGESQGLDTLVQAAAVLKRDGYMVNWVIIGEGRLKQQLIARIAELDVTDRFFLLGSYPATEMPEFFAHADALVVCLKKSPIFQKTIPSKLQSCLACGKAIVCSSHGITGEIVAEANAGFVAAAEDGPGLAAAVVSLYNLSPEEREVLGKNGRDYFLREFERERLLNRLEDILNE